jgi:hypothetical protein
MGKRNSDEISTEIVAETKTLKERFDHRFLLQE